MVSRTTDEVKSLESLLITVEGIVVVCGVVVRKYVNGSNDDVALLVLDVRIVAAWWLDDDVDNDEDGFVDIADDDHNASRLDQSSEHST